MTDYTYNTGNPIGSTDVRDGVDNLKSFDVLLNSTDDTYQDRLGNTVPTAAGAIKALGPVVTAWTFTTGGTLNYPNEAALNPVDGNYYGWTGAFPKVVAPGTDPTVVPGFVPRTDVVLRHQLSGNWADDPNLSIDITEAGGLANDFRIRWRRPKASLRAGLRDNVPLDDPLNFFRGLAVKDTWNNDSMQGYGSVSFGRNGASYAYLSATFGHDCVVYGAAGLAGGAGSCAGNPDTPDDNSSYGYCSFSYGKMTIARGRISNAMGQECQANSLVSSADGYLSITGPGLASHPNEDFPGVPNMGVVSEGRAARAHGWKTQAYGDFAVAMGSYTRAYNGSVVIGSGVDDVHLLQATRNRSLMLGAYATTPGVILLPDGGVRNKVGLNTHFPTERIEAVLDATTGDAFSIRTEGGAGNGKFALQGTLASGAPAEILGVSWNSPSSTVAAGEAMVSINGVNTILIDSSGVVKFLHGSIEMAHAGQGVKLTSPNGLITKILRLSNSGALELV